MATLFISVIGARVVIATDDHCSPHVHALHRGEEWIVRLSFSDVTVEAGVLSIAPTEQAVRQRQLNQLLDEVEAYVAKCRRVWWEIKGTTCLPNKWVPGGYSGSHNAELMARGCATDQGGVLRQRCRCDPHYASVWWRDDDNVEPRRQHVTRNRISDAEYARAVEAGEREAREQFRASSVRYLADCDAIEILTMRDGGFVVPRRLVGVLQDTIAADLTELQLWPDGSIIEIAGKDLHISVHGLIRAALPVLVPRPVVAGMFAAQGGSARSKQKAATARENGKKGGRPRKHAA